MLKLNNITKSYVVGDFSQIALKSVSLEFDRCEFVAVLGHSGSGKTTLLNIIGGLDRYDSGELTINGRPTQKFKGADWDAYRNNSIGFVFQNYNLIGHLTVAENIEIAMTLSGLSRHKRRQKSQQLLERVGLLDHAKKKPGQLSGGQMQRVAIARALANDPDIILADEPTGALDIETSVQILDLIREIAKDKLVIMVTHNAVLAKRYASRLIELSDGKVISDSGNQTFQPIITDASALKKSSMGFFTALKLSFKNIMTKKGRTFLTALASSIGIAGIALILSLSNGFNFKIKEFETGALSEYPIMLNKQSFILSESTLQDALTQKEYPDDGKIHPHTSSETELMHINKFTEEYVHYVESIDNSLVSGISFARALGLNILTKANGTVQSINALSTAMTELPQSPHGTPSDIISRNYDLLVGSYPVNKEDIVLVVDSRNRVDKHLITAFGLDAEDAQSLDEFIGLELRLIYNDDYYQENGEFYSIRLDLDDVHESSNFLPLNICGVMRIKKNSMLDILSPGLAYTYTLAEHVIENAKASEIVKSFENIDYNVLTGELMDLSTEEGQMAKEALLGYFGSTRVPLAIMIYPRDFNAKETILSYLDQWNSDLRDDEKIIYTDTASIITTLAGSIIDAIAVVLIAFSAISLVVSMIMIGIITYISVIERTREIGLLRALGARKRDISRVFNAETFIIGLISGILGISGAYLLTLPTNTIIENLSNLPSVAKLHPVHMLVLILISLLLTLIGGMIPAKIASNKDPVSALRTE